MIKMKKKVIGFLVLGIALLIGISLLFFMNQSDETLNLSGELNTVQLSGAEVSNAFVYTKIDSNLLIGKWRGTFEDSIDGKNFLAESTIEFRQDGTYLSILEGNMVEGVYIIEEDILYLDGLDCSVNLDKYNLGISCPEAGKITYYEKLYAI